ncbi:MAG TPA: hypothetical protein VFT45_15195 [Longimicrobium sp.]|nr:hypothetical protein [Longimicrobium sp.]
MEFAPERGGAWVGNFARGLGGVTAAVAHPDGRRVLVFAEGDLWSVDPESRAADEFAQAVEAFWLVREPDGFVLSVQGLAFLRVGPSGILWHTRRLSWDGFNAVQLSNETISGEAWNAVEDRWMPFEVNLATGASAGGSFGSGDPEGWQRLASPRDAA